MANGRIELRQTDKGVLIRTDLRPREVREALREVLHLMDEKMDDPKTVEAPAGDKPEHWLYVGGKVEEL